MADAPTPPTLVWSDPAWLAETHGWIDDRLGELGRQRVGAIEQPHVVPWSTALRVPTDEGDLWCKASDAIHRHEAAVIELLAPLARDHLPVLLAVDRERGLMLQRDGGERLRELLAGTDGLDRWAQILPLQAELQIASARLADALLATGAADRRVGSLPAQLDRLLSDRAALQPDAPDALTDDEVTELADQAGRIDRLCDLVAALGLPDTIVHGDLNDGQVFVRDGEYRILDWGDASVGHPFFDTVVPLRVLAYRQRIRQLDGSQEPLRDAYLRPFTALRPLADLQAVFADAYRLGSLARLLDHHAYVATLAPDVAIAYDYAGAVPTGVRLLLETLDGRARVWPQAPGTSRNPS